LIPRPSNSGFRIKNAGLRLRGAAWSGLAVLLWSTCAWALVVAPPPGQQVTARSEQVVLVHDPLTATQTVVVQLTFDGTSKPFGLIIPTPQPAEATVVSDRLWRAVRNRLHPQGKVRRTLDLELGSWIGGCALREVGDAEPVEPVDRGTATTAKATTLGTAAEPLHDWLLENGFTLAPAQAAWLSRLRGLGWTLTGVVVRPGRTEGAPSAVLKWPVLAFTHAAADGPMYAAAHPAFALMADEALAAPALEVAVLTEWPVAPDSNEPADPFYADAITGRDVVRLGSDAGGLPWAFRRDGTLTAFELPRPTGLGVLRFVRCNPYPPRRPEPSPQLRAHHLKVPIEALLLVFGLTFWAWLRFVRGRNTHRRPGLG
jgi:hypothetical protein